MVTRRQKGERPGRVQRVRETKRGGGGGGDIGRYQSEEEKDDVGSSGGEDFNVRG